MQRLEWNRQSQCKHHHFCFHVPTTTPLQLSCCHTDNIRIQLCVPAFNVRAWQTDSNCALLSYVFLKLYLNTHVPHSNYLSFKICPTHTLPPHVWSSNCMPALLRTQKLSGLSWTVSDAENKKKKLCWQLNNCWVLCSMQKHSSSWRRV